MPPDLRPRLQHPEIIRTKWLQGCSYAGLGRKMTCAAVRNAGWVI